MRIDVLGCWHLPSSRELVYVMSLFTLQQRTLEDAIGTVYGTERNISFVHAQYCLVYKYKTKATAECIQLITIDTDFKSFSPQ